MKVSTDSIMARRINPKNKTSFNPSVLTFSNAEIIRDQKKYMNIAVITGTINLPFTYGNLKLRSPLMVSFGKRSTPPETSTNANKVPMLVRSVMRLAPTNKDGIDTRQPVMIVEI